MKKIEIDLSDEVIEWLKQNGQDAKKFSENLINLSVLKMRELQLAQKTLRIPLTHENIIAEGEKVGKEVFDKSKDVEQ